MRGERKKKEKENRILISLTTAIKDRKIGWDKNFIFFDPELKKGPHWFSRFHLWALSLKLVSISFHLYHSLTSFTPHFPFTLTQTLCFLAFSPPVFSPLLFLFPLSFFAIHFPAFLFPIAEKPTLTTTVLWIAGVL